MRILYAIAALATAATLTTPAFAGWVSEDWYVSIGAGVAIPEDMDTSNVINPAASEELSFDTGYSIVGAIGDSSPRFIRSELEVGYRSFDADQLTDGTNTFGPFNMDGDAEVWNVGWNGYYDFELESMIQPYVGVGVGAAYFSVDVNNASTPAANVWSAEDWGFYYQGIIGASAEVGPKHRLFIEYRYFSTMGVNAESNFGAFTPDTNDDQFRSHSIMAGFRISF